MTQEIFIWRPSYEVQNNVGAYLKAVIDYEKRELLVYNPDDKLILKRENCTPRELKKLSKKLKKECNPLSILENNKNWFFYFAVGKRAWNDPSGQCARCGKKLAGKDWIKYCKSIVIVGEDCILHFCKNCYDLMEEKECLT